MLNAWLLARSASGEVEAGGEARKRRRRRPDPHHGKVLAHTTQTGSSMLLLNFPTWPLHPEAGKTCSYLGRLVAKLQRPNRTRGDLLPVVGLRTLRTRRQDRQGNCNAPSVIIQCSYLKANTFSIFRPKGWGGAAG